MKTQSFFNKAEGGITEKTFYSTYNKDTNTFFPPLNRETKFSYSFNRPVYNYYSMYAENKIIQSKMKNLAEKTERPHIKRFKVQSNLENNMTVITEPRKIRAIQLGPKHDTHPLSAERRVVRKKMFPEGNKNFYYDAFNSIKENQNDLVKDIKNTVSYYIFNFF